MVPSCFEVILVGFILILPFLYEMSRTFRYYFKISFYCGYMMINSFLLLPILMLRPRNVKNYLTNLLNGGDIAYERQFRYSDDNYLKHTLQMSCKLENNINYKINFFNLYIIILKRSKFKY